MKIKLMMALVVTALVSVIILAACDDGNIQQILEGKNETILDTFLVPYYDNDGNIQNVGPNKAGGDTTKNYPFYMVDIPDLYYLVPPDRPNRPPNPGEGGGGGGGGSGGDDGGDDGEE